jgi:hypothetical protein
VGWMEGERKVTVIDHARRGLMDSQVQNLAQFELEDPKALYHPEGQEKRSQKTAVCARLGVDPLSSINIV